MQQLRLRRGFPIYGIPIGFSIIRIPYAWDSLGNPWEASGRATDNPSIPGLRPRKSMTLEWSRGTHQPRGYCMDRCVLARFVRRHPQKLQKESLIAFAQGENSHPSTPLASVRRLPNIWYYHEIRRKIWCWWRMKLKEILHRTEHNNCLISYSMLTHLIAHAHDCGIGSFHSSLGAREERKIWFKVGGCHPSRCVEPTRNQGSPCLGAEKGKAKCWLEPIGIGICCIVGQLSIVSIYINIWLG